MLLPATQKQSHFTVGLPAPLGRVLILSGTGLLGFFLWRRIQKEREEHMSLFDQTLTLDNEEVEDMMGFITSPRESEERKDKAPGYVLYHLRYGTTGCCSPEHWHRTYILKFIEIPEQQSQYAIIQHTETERYHVMMRIEGELLSCTECNEQEVYRLPVQGDYRYFTFLPGEDLHGIVTLPQARDSVRALPEYRDPLLLEERNLV